MGDRIGDRIKAERLKAEWTQSELARQAGVQPHTISQIEKGDRNPSTEVLQKLAKALNTTVSKLLGQTTDDELSDLLQDEEVQGFFRGYKDLSAKDRDLILKQIEFLKSQGQKN